MARVFKTGITADGDVITGGKLQSTASAGDEGGEIFLNKAVTNTTLNGGVTIDVYQNKLRFFEQGGTARGFYIDITGGGASVGTNLVGGGATSNSFTTIAVPSGTNPVAASATDTLTFTAGTGISITGTASTDTIAIATNATDANTVSTIVTRDASGNFAAGTITAALFSGSGASLTSIPAANVTGTLTSTVLGNSALFIGTTSVALNRTTADLALTGITSITGGTGTTAIALNSAATTAAASGAINVITGATTTSGTTGAVTVRSGNSSAASGAVTVSTGTAVATTSGTLTLSTGSGSGTGGQSGAISIATGAAGSTGNSGAITMDVGTKTTGTFGTITIGGTNASAIAIGNATNTATANLISSTSVNLNSPAINSNAATLALLATPTTITAGAAATAVTVGASTGTLTLNNPTIATSVTSGTLAMFNTGLTGTLSIGGAAGTINIGASTTTKVINIGTATTTGNSSTINIGTAQASTTSDILLQGAIYAGKSVSGTGNQTGYYSNIYGAAVTATGTTGNATAGNLTILAPDAILSNASNITGNATSGSLILDAGNSQFNAGSPVYGTISIGTLYASLITLGKSGTAVKIPTGTVPTSSLQQFGMIAGDAESIQLATTKTTGAGPGFGFIRAPQMVYANANSGAATTTTPVSPFVSGNDVLSSLEVGKSYRFRGTYYFTSTWTSGAATMQLLFAFSNAPVIFKYNYKTYKSTGVTAFDLAGLISTNAATTISAGVGATATYVVEFEGFFTSNATTASTFTPQFQMSTTGSSTIATAGSFIEIEKLGTSTQTLIAGNWA